MFQRYRDENRYLFGFKRGIISLEIKNIWVRVSGGMIMTGSFVRSALRAIGFLSMFVFLAASVGSSAAAVPDEWDWRDVEGLNLTSGVRALGRCSADFIFSPVGMVESREMIERWHRGLPIVEPDYSEQYIVACGSGYFGDFDCETGGYCKDTLTFLRDTGVPREECYNYIAVDESCPADCPDSADPLQLFQVVNEIGEHYGFIYDNGPVATVMDIYTDFLSFVGDGIYQHVTGDYAGSHAVLIIGWGVEDSTPYWLIENNWGAAWGDGGYFKILRDANHANCDFGEWLWWCSVTPALSPVPGAPAAKGTLAQNSPNPFNPSTTISYTAENDGPLTLTVFDTAGRRVRTLISAPHLAGREYRVEWNGRDDSGQRAASGLYFYRLDNRDFSETKRMVLLN